MQVAIQWPQMLADMHTLKRGNGMFETATRIGRLQRDYLAKSWSQRNTTRSQDEERLVLTRIHYPWRDVC